MPVKPPTFRPRGERTKQARDHDADQRRGSARSRGYNGRWDKAAATFRRRHPLCRGCEAAGLVVACDLVDHVVPHRGDSDRFWDTAMWQTSCRWHHDTVKQRLEVLFDRGRCTVADLWLDSPFALRLAAELRGE